MDEISIVDCVKLLKARRWTVGAVSLAALVITGVALLFWPRTYEGETALIFPQQATDSLGSQLAQLAGLPLLGGVTSLSGRDVYVSVLKSRTISENVLRRLGLDDCDLDFEDMQDHLSLEAPKEGGLVVTCQVPTSWLKGHVPRRELRDRTAQLAARVANTYIDELQTYDRSNSLFLGRKNRVFIEKQLARSKDELSQAEDQLEEFQKGNPTLIPPENASKYAEQAQEIATKQIEADVAVRETQGQLEKAQAIWRAGAPKSISPEAIADNPAIDVLRTQLATLEVKRATLLESFTEKHPDVVSLSHEIDKTYDKLRAETARVVSGRAASASPAQQELLKQLVLLEVTRDGMAARQTALSGSWNNVELRLSDLPKQEMEYARLLRDLKAAEMVYTTLLAEHAKARVAEGRETDNFIVLDMAKVPEKPEKPRVKTTLAVAIMLGLVLGVAIAVMQGIPAKKP